MCENICQSSTHLPKGVSRRDILKVGAAAAGLVALGPMGKWLPAAHGAPQALKRLVVVNLFGGNDTTNMVPPTTLQTYFDRRPTIALQPGEGLSLNVGSGSTTLRNLHPAMPLIHSAWTDGQLAIVQKVGYPRANLSHFISQDIWSLAVRDDFSKLKGVERSGWIARYAGRFAPTPMGAVSIGAGRPLDFEGGDSNPLMVSSLGSFRIRTNGSSSANNTAEALHRTERAKSLLARFHGAGNSAEAKIALDQAYQLADQVQTAVANYSNAVTFPNTTLGRRLKDVSTLIEAGFETQVFFTGIGGFDNHGNEGGATGTHANLLAQVDGAIGALVEDAKRQNIWDDTVIVVITEFGRRSFENGSVGTDHGEAFDMLVLGGGVNGGLYGADLSDADLARNQPQYDVDFRSVYKEIVDRHMRADDKLVFPEPLERTHNLGIL